MKPRVVWQGVPSEHRAAFKPYVLRYLPTLPCWVKTLTITYDVSPDAEGERAFLAASAQEEMREATVHYRAAWLEGDEETRAQQASHEFAHIPFLPVVELVEQILNDANAPPALRKQWDARLEAATQDVAVIIRGASVSR